MSDLLKQLAQQGLLGIVAALALWFAWVQTKKLEESQEKRITDVERVITAINASTDALREHTQSMRRVLEEVLRRG